MCSRFVCVRPRYGDCPLVHDSERATVDGIAVVDSREAAGAVVAGPAEDPDVRSGAAGGKITDEQNVAVGVGSREGMAAILRDVGVLPDLVPEEPEPGRGVAAVVVAVQPSI